MTEDQIEEYKTIEARKVKHEAALHSLPIAFEMLRLARPLPYPTPEEIAIKAFEIAECFYNSEQQSRKQ